MKGQQGQSHGILNEALKDSTKKEAYESQNRCYTIADMQQGIAHNPKGVFYMSSNSATGSKFYEPIPQQQDCRRAQPELEADVLRRPHHEGHVQHRHVRR